MEEGGGGFGSRLSGHSAGRCSRVPEPVWARSGGSDQSRQTTPVPGGMELAAALLLTLTRDSARSGQR